MKYRIYRVTAAGERIDGMSVQAFIHNENYYLVQISIFRDGMIDCWGPVDFEGFKQQVRSGKVVTQPPEKARIGVTLLASFIATDARYPVEVEELIKQVADEIEALNGRTTSSERCRAAWDAYQVSPSDVAMEALRAAYEAIPGHLRLFVLRDMDSKDGPIRRVLYPHERN